MNSRLRNIASLLLLSFFFFSFSSPDPYASKLKGRVLKMTETTYGIQVDSSGKMNEKWMHDSLITNYNSAMKPVSIEHFGGEGKEQYDIRRVEFHYLLDTLPVSTLFFTNDRITDSLRVQFNTMRQEETAVHFQVKGNKTVRTFCSYKDGRLLSMCDLSEKGDTIRKTVYVYYASGKLKEELFYRPGRNSPALLLNSTTTYNYNTLGKVSAIQYVSGNFKTQSAFVYNENGDLQMVTDISSYGETISWYEYTYDEHGNWTKRLQYTEVHNRGAVAQEKQPVEVTRRKTAYAD